MIRKNSTHASVPVNINGVSGRRTVDLVSGDLETLKVRDLYCREQRSRSFSQQTEFPRANVACKLIDIKKLLVQSGTRVGVIEMLNRVDVKLAIIDETNVILKQQFQRNLFSSITIYKQIMHQSAYHPVASADYIYLH